MTNASDWPCVDAIGVVRGWSGRLRCALPRFTSTPPPAPAATFPDGGAPDEERDFGTVVEERPAKPQLKQPPMYKVILLNDDYTRMEFVVHVLMRFFDMDAEKATQVMYTIHTGGSAVVGIYPRDIAETKSEQVNAYAQENEFPLRSTVEMTD